MERFDSPRAAAALLDLARARLRPERLPSLVMNDPGTGDYVDAYGKVLAGGTSALMELQGGLPLARSFDITENLLLSHSSAGRSRDHRWFSVLTASIELLAWDGYEGLRGAQPSQTLYHLLRDAFALMDLGSSPHLGTLLLDVTNELQSRYRHPHHRLLALLCEILVGDWAPAAADPKCAELHRAHEEFQVWGDDEGVENESFAERSEFVWGAVLRAPYGLVPRGKVKELPGWIELVKARFPATSVLSRETRERLIREGEAWQRLPRKR